VAHAQNYEPVRPVLPATGRSGMSTADALGNVNAFTDLSHFGRCMASTNRQGAFTVLATAPGSREEGAAIDPVLHRGLNCLHGGTSTTASTVYLRGVIAEGLLTDRTPLPANLVQTPIAADAVRNTGDIGRCFVGSHRAEGTALLATRLGSAEEMAAVRGLWTNFNACIPRRFSIRLNAQWIRFIIAEALLRVPAGAAAPAGS
jgi:hypothetical protein